MNVGSYLINSGVFLLEKGFYLTCVALWFFVNFHILESNNYVFFGILNIIILWLLLAFISWKLDKETERIY